MQPGAGVRFGKDESLTWKPQIISECVP
jgi:hypothetical protein